MDELSELLLAKYNSRSILEADVKSGIQPLQFDLTSQ